MYRKSFIIYMMYIERKTTRGAQKTVRSQPLRKIPGNEVFLGSGKMIKNQRKRKVGILKTCDIYIFRCLALNRSSDHSLTLYWNVLYFFKHLHISCLLCHCALKPVGSLLILKPPKFESLSCYVLIGWPYVSYDHYF